MRVTMVAAMAAAGLLLVGCAGEEGLSVDAPVQDDGDPGADPDDGQPDADPDDGEDPAAGSDAVLGAETMAAIDALVADGVDRDAIEVVTAEFVTWSDGAIGCPDDEMGYTQALVDGYRIVLDVAGDEVFFHGAEGEPPFRCDDPQPPVDG